VGGVRSPFLGIEAYMIEIVKEFAFEAAHRLPVAVPEGHPYARLHGHSYRVDVHLRGEPDPKTGWIVDFGRVEAAIRPIRERLDHNYLNDIPGLELPTLETIARWIHREMASALPQTRRVVVRRGTSGEACVYEPEG
jgi:6-pyruvoyltetrahydropterin/6-carboxytetrahydropterin synthase